MLTEAVFAPAMFAINVKGSISLAAPNTILLGATFLSFLVLFPASLLTQK